MNLPRLAITLGDPAGIGPEIIGKLLLSGSISRRCSPVIIGDTTLLPPLFQKKHSCKFIHIPVPSRARLRQGKISAYTGQASYDAIIRAVELARSGDVDGIVTAPISKAALHLAGHRYPGHTELLAALTGSKNYAMLMVAGTLRTIMVTRHIPVSLTGKKLDQKHMQ